MSDCDGEYKLYKRHLARLRHAVAGHRLGGLTLRVYTLLWHHGDNETGLARPAVGTLAAELGYGPKTVRKALAELQRIGLVETVKGGRGHGGRGLAAERRLTDPPASPETHADPPPVSPPKTGGNPGRNRGHSESKTGAGLGRLTLVNAQRNAQQRRRGNERDAAPALPPGPATAAGAAAGGDEHGGRSGGRLAEAAAVLDARGVCEPSRTELLDLLAAAADAAAGPDADAARRDALAAAGLRAVADATDGGPGLVVIRVRERGAAAVAEAATRLVEREAAAARVTSGSAVASHEASANAADSPRVLAAFGLAPADLAAAVPADWHAEKRGAEAIHPLLLACVLSSAKAAGGAADLAQRASSELMRRYRNMRPDVLLMLPRRVQADSVGAMLHAGLLPPGRARLTEGGTVAVVGHAVGPDVPAAEAMPLLMSTLDTTAADRAAYAAEAAGMAGEGAAP